MVWRWTKVSLPGRLQQLLAGRLRHLDEVAEHVVVPDLQRAAAGLVGVARLERGDDAARLVAQLAQPRRARRRSPRARSRRRASAAAARRRAPRASASASVRVERGAGVAPPRASSVGSIAARRRARAEVARRAQGRRAGGEVARAAAAEARRDSARARSGARLQRCARRRSRRSPSLDERRRPRRAARAIAARSVSGAGEPLGEQPRAARVTVRSMAASRLPARSPDERCASARDWRASPRRSPASRRALSRRGRRRAAGGCRSASSRHRRAAPPAAASSARAKAPKPSSVATPK